MNTEIYVKVGDVSQVIGGTVTGKITEKATKLSDVKISDDTNYVSVSNIARIEYNTIPFADSYPDLLIDQFKLREALDGCTGKVVDYTSAYSRGNYIAVEGNSNTYNGVSVGNIFKFEYDNTILASVDTGYEVSCITRDTFGDLLVGSDKMVKYDSSLVLDGSFATVSTNGIINTISYNFTDNSYLVGGSFSSVNGNTVSNIFKCSINGVIDTSIASLNVGTNGEVVEIHWADDSPHHLLILGNFTEYNGLEENRIVKLDDSTYLKTLYTSTGFKTLDITQNPNDVIFNKKCLVSPNIAMSEITVGINYKDEILYNDVPVKKLLSIKISDLSISNDFSYSDIIQYSDQSINKLSLLTSVNFQINNEDQIFANIENTFSGSHFIRCGVSIFNTTPEVVDIIYSYVDTGSYYYASRYTYVIFPDLFTTDFILGGYNRIEGVETGVTINSTYTDKLLSLKENSDVKTILASIGNISLFNLLDVKADSLGRIYLLGYGDIEYNGVATQPLIRILSDGTLDTTFDSTAFFVAYPQFTFFRPPLIADNEFLTIDSLNNEIYLVNLMDSVDHKLFRLLEDGTIDPTFDLTDTDLMNTPLILSTGKLLVSQTTKTDSEIRLLNIDGTYDLSFSTITVDTLFNNRYDNIFRNLTEDLFTVVGYFTTVNAVSYNGIATFDITGTVDTTFDSLALLSDNTGDNRSQQFNDVLYIFGAVVGNTYSGTSIGHMISIDIYTGDLLDDEMLPPEFLAVYDNSYTGKFIIQPNDNLFPRVYIEYKNVSGDYSLFTMDLQSNVITLNSSGHLGLSKYWVDYGNILITPDYYLQIENYVNNSVERGGVDYALTSAPVDVNVFNICNLDYKGFLKPTFNQGTGFNGQVYSTKLMSNGIIVCVGNFSTYNGVSANRIAFLNTDGSLHTASMANVGVGFDNPVYKVIERMDTNKLVIGGAFNKYKGVNRFKIIQLNLDGTVDTGITGITTGSNGDIWDIVHDLPNNKFYISGTFTQYNGTSRVGIASLTSNLALNTGFVVGTGFSGAVVPALVKAGWAVDVQTDGKVLVGHNFTTYNGVAVKSIVRLNTDGTRDTTFQTNIGTGPTGVYSVVKEVKVQSDGKILIGGNFQSFNGNVVANMCRLLPTGVFDTTFNTNTLFNSINGNGYDIGIVQAIAIQTDGKIMVGGQFLTPPATVYFNKGVQRINADGSLDLSYGKVDLQYSYVGQSVLTDVNEIVLNLTNNDTLVVGRFDKYHYVAPTSNTSGGVQIVNSNVYDKLSLFKDEDILMNFILKDANDLSKVFSTYSQTFAIPADDINNEILGHFFNTSVARSGDISFDAKIYIKKSLFKIGTIKIENGNYERNRLISYNITFSTGIGLLLKLMGTDKLSDINYDSIGFTYNKDWAYNQIQNGSLSNDVQIPLISTDRVWGYNDGSLFDLKAGSGKAITFKELKPAIRFDSIMQSIINRYSLNIDCPLFSRDEYRKIYAWLNSLSTEKKRKVVLPFGVATNKTNGYFFFNANLPEDYLSITLFNNNYNINRRMTIQAQLLGLKDNTSGDILADTDVTIYYVDRLTNANLAVVTARTNSIGTLQTNWTIPQPTVNTTYEIRFFAETNEVIRYDSFNVICKVNDTSPAITPLDSALQGLYNEPKFDISNYLGDVTVFDFFASFFKMFNISVIDNNITNKMTFLTPGEIYNDTLDYTPYVDIKTHTIKPQPIYKTYDFKYVDSEYFRNFEFKKLVGLEYGELRYNRNDIGTVGEYKIEPNFGIMNYFYMQSNLGALNVKTSYGFIGGEDKDSTTQLYKPYKPKGLTLMYVEDKVPITVGATAASLNFSKSTGITGLTSYIRFGNQEDLNDANNDNSLTFSVDVEEVYGSFTKNLFTNYYDSTIQRIVNGNTRTFTVKAVLPTFEINRFSLRNIIIIGDRRFTIDSATVNIITGDTTLTLTNIAPSPIKFV